MQIEDNAIILSNHWGWIEPTSPLERPFDKSSLRIPAMFSENYVAHSQAKRPNINQINSPKTDDEPSLDKEPVLRHGRDCLPRLATNLSTVVPHQFAMKLFSLSLIAISSMAMVGAQPLPAATQWCTTEITGSDICFQRYRDTGSDTAWGYLFPAAAGPTGQPTNEFIGIFTGRSNAGYIGASLGGTMTSNPLVLAWINGRAPLISLRRTEQYGPPPVLNTPGPVVTVLGGSGITAAGQQRIIYRCTNCTTWQGGSNGINLNAVTHNLGFVSHSTAKPSPPSSAAGGVMKHTLAGRHSLNVTAVKDATYWSTLQALQTLPALP